MKLHPRLSGAAVELVTRFETFQPQAQPATAGGWTIGYGHTRSAREGAQVTRADAEALLLYDLDAAARDVEAALFAPVTQHQFEAMTAFAFNIGVVNFLRSSALARMNGGAELDAADEIERWRHAELGAGPQVVDALVRRRAAEKAHFLGLPEGASKSPSAVLRPLAVEGAHEPEPPPMEIAPARSATLSAANTVQARLRELVPDPDPAPPARVQDHEDPAALAVEDAHEPEARELEAPEAKPPSSEPLLVAEAPPILAPEPTVTPFTPPPPPVPEVVVASPPANDAALPPAAVEPEPATPRQSAAEAPSAAPSPSPRRELPARAIYAALTALGACLLVAAAVMILGGKAGFGELGLAVIGVLLMIPGVYGLLGPSRPAS